MAAHPESTAETSAYSALLARLAAALASGGERPRVPDPEAVADSFRPLLTHLATDPESVSRHLAALLDELAPRLRCLADQLREGCAVENTAPPAFAGDKRFRDPSWSEPGLFRLFAETYQIIARHLREWVAGVEGLSAGERQRLDFYTERVIEMFSPANFPLTNPVVVKRTIAEHGDNLLRGFQTLVEDIEHGKGRLAIRTCPRDAFEIGRDLATTPGRVVWQTPLMQLIQYLPRTDTVHARPLLIVPPWINKFYILDMRSENSLMRWLTGQGFTVFLISWVNPDAAMAETGFEDYLRHGTLAAVDAITRATGEPVNVAGYCIGGTLLACTLAHLAARGGASISSATFLTTMLDFQNPGELGVFIDPAQIERLEAAMARTGFLDGGDMAQAFSLLKANDLIWSFHINNYLLGDPPRAFDLLYWNADSTRMPARMHSFYLRNMYLENKLCQPGAIRLLDTPLDLSAITTPAYFLSTEDDHIAPWRATYAGARQLGGPVRFVLGGSGHIAGVVNPPAAGKYGYRSRRGLPNDPQRWFDGAAQQRGSWWPDWARWLRRHGGRQVSARDPDNGPLPVLDTAPGHYVRVRS